MLIDHFDVGVALLVDCGAVSIAPLVLEAGGLLLFEFGLLVFSVCFIYTDFDFKFEL